MAKKLTINISQEQKEMLVSSLRLGSPLTVALSYAGISPSTYYYWLSIASVVHKVKQIDELRGYEEVIKSGVSIEEIKLLMANLDANEGKKTAMSYFIDPPEEAILRYKTSRTYKKFADEVYELIESCNRSRAECVLDNLNDLRKARKDKRINPSVSFWVLEKTLPGTFGKAVGTMAAEGEERIKVDPIKVEFVDPKDKETEKRVKMLEQEIDAAVNGRGWN